MRRRIVLTSLLIIIFIFLYFMVKSFVSHPSPPPVPYCGDGFCSETENCGTCPQDCPCPSGTYCYKNSCKTEWEILDIIVRRNDYTKYTHSTYLLDYNSPEISTLSDKLKTDSVKQTIYNYFTYVSQNIKYGMPIWENPCYPASETVKKGYGICQNKERVFISLARKQGIPARAVEVCINPDMCGWNIICHIESRLSCHVISQVFYIEYDETTKTFKEKWVYVDSTLGRIMENLPDLYTRARISDEPSCFCHFRCL